MGNQPNGQVVGGPSWQSFIMGQDGSLSPWSQGTMTGYQMPGQNAANLQGSFLGAQAYGDAATRQKMANAIDPTTGQLLKTPQTKAEWLEVSRQAENLASTQARANFQQEASMLGYQSNGIGLTGGNGSASTGTMGGQAGIGSAGAAGSAGSSLAGVPQSASSVPIPEVDPELLAGFKTNLLSAINNPGISDRTQQDMVNKANEGLSIAQSDASRQLTGSAAAAGYTPAGGSVQQGQQALASQYAGQKATNARNTNIDVANQRQQQMMSALNLGGNYLGKQQDAQQSYYRWQAQQSTDNRNMMLNLMEHQQPALPSVAGGGYGQTNAFPISGVAGGAYSGNASNAGFAGFGGGGMGSSSPAAPMPRGYIGMSAADNSGGGGLSQQPPQQQQQPQEFAPPDPNGPALQPLGFAPSTRSAPAPYPGGSGGTSSGNSTYAAGTMSPDIRRQKMRQTIMAA